MIYQTPLMFCSLPDFHVPFLVLHTTSPLRQTWLSISCLFFFFPISRFSVIPLFCFQRPQGLLVPDLCLSLQRTPFISPLQPRPVLRGAHSITQLLIWEVFHISKRHSWMNNKSSNIRWGRWVDKHCWWAQTELLYSNEANVAAGACSLESWCVPVWPEPPLHCENANP